MHWTHILTKKEKKHIKDNVARLIGMSCKKDVIDALKQCDCNECRAILAKLTAKPTGRSATYVIPVEPVVIPHETLKAARTNTMGHLVDDICEKLD